MAAIRELGKARGFVQVVPALRTLLDPTGLRLVLHAPFGGRVNAPWGMALAPSNANTSSWASGRSTMNRRWPCW